MVEHCLLPLNQACKSSLRFVNLCVAYILPETVFVSKPLTERYQNILFSYYQPFWTACYSLLYSTQMCYFRYEKTKM